jgi:hypothetical protein
VHILDRLFDGENVAPFVIVDVAGHCSQCGGFSRTGGSGDQYKSTRFQAEVFQHLRQTDLFETRDLIGDHTHGGGTAATLTVHVDPVAVQLRKRPGEVHFSICFKDALLLIIHQKITDFLNLFRRKHSFTMAHQFPSETQHRWLIRRKMYVRYLLLHSVLEQSNQIKFHSNTPLLTRRRYR